MLGFGGVTLVVGSKLGGVAASDFGAMLLPALLALLGITVGTLYQKRYCPSFDLRTGSVIQFVPTLLLTAAVARATETMQITWAANSCSRCCGWCWCCRWVRSGLLNLLIRSGGAVNAASLFYLTPPCTALIAWAIFGERSRSQRWPAW